MRKALLYKEWKKTKIATLCIAMTGVLLLVYIFLKLNRSIRFAGMEHLWDVIVNRNQFMFRDLKYFAPFAGLGLGLAQFIPEIIQKRIKLTLHLPMKETEIVAIMLFYGLMALFSLFVFQLGAISVFAKLHFPYEFIENILLTLAPWYLSGITIYIFVAMICLEPSWKRRVYNTLLAVGTMPFFYISDFPGAYLPSWAWCVLLPLYILPFVFISINRFKSGVSS
ncbi:MAG: hypothetical protein CSB01_01805 [Bacteroidia bacterium]|nr:MAG: hypothetical protein CSB01_01805 [Bacteroidia bacterium]